MNLSVGIVGLPNVGKSTLFNALLKKQQAFVANYPFATIEPNIGVVSVPDPRLEKLAEIVAEEEPHPNPATLVKQANSASPAFLKGEGVSISPSPSRERVGVRGKRPPIVPATVKFVDIAGLVKGANEGAGLGNKFLSHIREVSIIAHVVRAFEDENIIKEGAVDPKTDYEAINTELILADLESLAKSKPAKKPSILSSIDGKRQAVLEKIHDSFNRGIPVRNIGLSGEEKELINGQFLLSAKPEIVVLNVSEDSYTKDGIDKILKDWSRSLVYDTKNMIVICAKIEAELAELSEEDQRQYLQDLGLEQSGLERLIQKAYETLGLISFLTAPASAEASARQGGKWEVRAWTIKKGENAQNAAGEIHTDFIKKFIKAEVVSFEDFVTLGGWKGAREKGKARMEGRDYIVNDGDVVEFKIGA